MPASVLPVKEIAAISVLEASLVPIIRPEPVKQLTAFLGTPASTSIPAIKMVPIGVSDAGLQIMLLPPHSAGAILCAANDTGKL